MKLGDIASIIYSVLYLDENIIRTKSTDGDRYECRSIAGIRFFTMPAVPPSTYLFESISTDFGACCIPFLRTILFPPISSDYHTIPSNPS